MFSGEEFSKKHFPREVYEHDVELIEDIPQLSSRPFPVSGIRLSQLKDDIKELCKEVEVVLKKLGSMCGGGAAGRGGGAGG